MLHLLTRLRRTTAAAALAAIALTLVSAPSATAAPFTLSARCDLLGAASDVRVDLDVADEFLLMKAVTPFRVTAISGAGIDALDPSIEPTFTVRGFASSPIRNEFRVVTFSPALEQPASADPITAEIFARVRLEFDLRLRLASAAPDGTTTGEERYCRMTSQDPSVRIPTAFAIPPATNVRTVELHPTAFELAWDQAGVEDASFEVQVLPYEVISPHTYPTATRSLRLTNLKPGTTYNVSVLTKSADGYAFTTDYPITTPPEPLGRQSFRLSGVTAVPKLFQGNATVTGALDLSLNADGSLADTSLTLDPVTVPLVIERNVPITAKLTFLTAAKPTGTLKAGVLKFAAAIRVKVTDARLFGTVPIATGSNCQARNLTRFSFTSPVGFTRDLGGSMMSGYEFGDLVGCTGLNGLLSRETTSRFNTIKVEATPARR